jgi:hypothetical protein
MDEYQCKFAIDTNRLQDDLIVAKEQLSKLASERRKDVEDTADFVKEIVNSLRLDI